jgi:hypothetical protein
MTPFARCLPLLLVLLGGCAEPPPAPAAATAASIDEFFQRFTDDWARRDPNFAISARYFEATSKTG